MSLGRRSLCCWRCRLSLGSGCSSLGTALNLFELKRVEARERRHAAARVLAIDLEQTGNEETLLFVGLGLPVVRLAQRDEEAHIPGPGAEIGVHVGGGVGLQGGEVVEIPCLADTERSVGVFFRLVDTYATGLAHGNDNDAVLFGLGGAGGGRWWGCRVR